MTGWMHVIGIFCQQMSVYRIDLDLELWPRTGFIFSEPALALGPIRKGGPFKICMFLFPHSLVYEAANRIINLWIRKVVVPTKILYIVACQLQGDSDCAGLGLGCNRPSPELNKLKERL